MLDSHSKLTLKRAEESARIILFQEQIENKKLLGIPTTPKPQPTLIYKLPTTVV
jgi:hypothetical protein